MKSEHDEKILIESVLLKDRAAFEKLIRQYEGLVIHIVGPLIKNEKDREISAGTFSESVWKTAYVSIEVKIIYGDWQYNQQ